MNNYKKITEIIINNLEQGDIVWRKPWKNSRLAENLSNGHVYRGMNQLLLLTLPYESRYFVTYKQAQELGGHVKKGEKGHKIIFWKLITVKEENQQEEEEQKEVPLMKFYTIFNIEQCEGIEEPQKEKVKHNPIKKCDEIIEGYKNKPKVQNKGDRAYYNPVKDFVNVPKLKQFETVEDYYSVIFHELVHSTGHQNRLNRFENPNTVFASEEYSKEELVAELGACFLSGQAEIEQKIIENSSAYIQGWIKALEEDPTLIVSAAQKAQKAVDYILN